jgi:hypothetical protein
MRAWLSFPTGIRRVRLGASVNLNTSARMHHLSATGAKVWRIGSTLMLAGLVIWLIASRDQDGRLSKSFLLVTFFVLGLRYIFKLAVVALFPPIEIRPAK